MASRFDLSNARRPAPVRALTQHAWVPAVAACVLAVACGGSDGEPGPVGSVPGAPVPAVVPPNAAPPPQALPPAPGPPAANPNPMAGPGALPPPVAGMVAPPAPPAGPPAVTPPPPAATPAWAPDYFPTDAWQEKPAADLGFDAQQLDAAAAFAGQSTTEALLVIQDGYIVSESYFRGFSAQRTHESYSMAKSVSSSLVGIAIGDGLLPGVEAKICDYYSEWDCSNTGDMRSQITLRHAMTLSTGLMWMEDWSAGGNFFANDAIRMSSAPGGPVNYVLGKPGAQTPGTVFQYSTGDPALLTGVIQGVTGKTALAYAKEKIFDPIGMTSASWNSDSAGRTTTFAGLQATARDYARFGFLFLNRGNWDGQQLVPETWVEEATKAQALEPWYGYLWHVNLPVRFESPGLPEDGYTAQGVQGQYIAVIPSERLVIVRLAADGFNTDYDIADLFGRILAAKQ